MPLDAPVIKMVLLFKVGLLSMDGLSLILEGRRGADTGGPRLSTIRARQAHPQVPA
jgi:hypothetical protein